jgi:hypothetical protein
MVMFSVVCSLRPRFVCVPSCMIRDYGEKRLAHIALGGLGSLATRCRRVIAERNLLP